MTLGKECRTIANEANDKITMEQIDQAEYLWEHFFVPAMRTKAAEGFYSVSFEIYLKDNNSCCFKNISGTNLRNNQFFDLNTIKKLVANEECQLDIIDNPCSIYRCMTISW